MAVDGDAGAVTELFAYLDSPDPDFAIVTPDAPATACPRAVTGPLCCGNDQAD
ncbi:alkyl sulfatase C-terminal domain-containing protein [Streptomyces avidinii]